MRILKGFSGVAGAFSIASCMLSPGLTTTSKSATSLTGFLNQSMVPFSLAPFVLRLISTLFAGSYLFAHFSYFL